MLTLPNLLVWSVDPWSLSMSQSSKPVRFLLVAVWLLLALALGVRWISGDSPGEMPEVLMAFVLLNLAFQWEGITRLVRQ